VPLGMMNDLDDDSGFAMDGNDGLQRFPQAAFPLTFPPNAFGGDPYAMAEPAESANAFGGGQRRPQGPESNARNAAMQGGGKGQGDPRGQQQEWQGGLRYAPDFSLDQLSENRQAPRQANPGQQHQNQGAGGKGGGGGKGSKGSRNKKGDDSNPMLGIPGPPPNMFDGAMQMPGGIGGAQMPGDMGPGLMAANPMDRNAAPPRAWANVTTVMMRNLPNKYTQRMLLTEINQIGFLGTFDFLYLPIDPETQANRGYAFLNFIDPSFAWMFKMSYEGRKMNRFNSSKVVSVMPATLQGFDANYTHYSSARVNRGDPAARPLFLREPTHSVPLKATRDRFNKRGNRPRGGNGDGPAPAPPGPGGPSMAGADGGQGPWVQQEGYGVGGGLAPMMPPNPMVGAGDGAGAASAPRPIIPQFCPHCGGPIQGHFQFCPHCGANVDFNQLSA